MVHALVCEKISQGQFYRAKSNLSFIEQSSGREISEGRTLGAIFRWAIFRVSEYKQDTFFLNEVRSNY